MPSQHPRWEDRDDLEVDDSCAGQPLELFTYGRPHPGLVKAIDELKVTPGGQFAAYRHPADDRYDAYDARQRGAGEAYAAEHHPGLSVKVRTRTVTEEGRRVRYVFVDGRGDS